MVERLVWSVLAQKQKKEIFDYWNKRNKSKIYSRKLNKLFNKESEMLLFYPNIGYETNFENVRIKLIIDYRLVYQIKENEIRILTIWDTRRNPEIFDNILPNIIR